MTGTCPEKSADRQRSTPEADIPASGMLHLFKTWRQSKHGGSPSSPASAHIGHKSTGVPGSLEHGIWGRGGTHRQIGRGSSLWPA